MIQSQSDKALLEQSKAGCDVAASLLLRRWGLMTEHGRLAEIMKQWKTLKTLSVSAAKKIALSK